MEKIITKIEPQKNNFKRFSVFLDDQFWLSIDQETVFKLNLHEGQLISVLTAEKIIQEAEIKKAFDKALVILARRPHSTSEIVKFLQRKGFEDKIVNGAVKKLLEKGYLNDEDFVQRWINNRKMTKPMGKYRLYQELCQKGVAEELVQKGIESELSVEEEREQAFVLAQKLFSKKGKSLEVQHKVGHFLLRRGYSYSIVKEVIALVIKEEDEEDIFKNF